MRRERQSGLRRGVSRRRRLRQHRPPTAFAGDADPGPEARRAARAALDRLEERERRLLLLRHEGFSYREIAEALGVAETSVGSLLLRAKRAFRAACEEEEHAHQ